MRTKDAIQHFGDAVKLAKALGITKQAVYKWPDVVPEGRQYQIEIITKGELRAERPSAA